ncbi:MAG: uracil-DNA glycosylase family protein [Gilvibacter sp.]
MFDHYHPYAPFFPKGATKVIVGTLPPPRFTSGDLKADDVNFCYGSRDGQLWPILDKIFSLNLAYENTPFAIEQRKSFLTKRGIAICDIVQAAKRDKIDASDLGMRDIELRDVLGILTNYPSIKTLLFTGGNSKNGPEYFFRKHLTQYNLKLSVENSQVPRIHSFKHQERVYKTVSLTAPSGAANRAVGSLESYKKLKTQNPSFNTLQFRVMQYKEHF